MSIEVALVDSVLRMLENFIPFMTGHTHLFCNVDEDVKNIKSELESMRPFIQSANESTKEPWLNDLRELAYDIEDVLYCFELHHQKSHGNPVAFIRKLMNRDDVATRIKSIQKELHLIIDRKLKYTSNNGASSSSQHRESEGMKDPRDFSPEISTENPVGIDESIKELVDWLRAGRLVGMPRIIDWFRKLWHSNRGRTPMVISVAGMSGIGKTLLVRQVLDNKKVKKYFKCRVLIKVPEPCTTEGLLRLIVIELHKKKRRPDPQGLPSMDRHRLVETLKSLHLKRYLLVLDDVWHVDELHVIKDALPSHRNGSRVIVTTTRRRKVRAYDHVHEVKPLQSDDAEKLLRESAFSPNHGPIPPHLSDARARILRICEGLPLAIVTIGNLLREKGADVIQWNKVDRSLDYDSECSKLLSRLANRYNGLPRHLKPCLIFLGIFPEGQLIKRMRLIQLWIAEGFIEENEEVADAYLNELVDYSMIQVAEQRYYGKVKSYKVHPLMRKFFVLKAKEQNFYVFSTERQAASISTVKIRRLLSISGDDMNGSQDLSHVRSFFAFNSNQSLVEGFCSKFKYLRVLDLENAPLTKFPESLVKLKFLRWNYQKKSKDTKQALSLANTDIRSLPKTVRKLKNLRVLNLKRTLISQLPEEIEKLTQLRQLSIMYRSDAAGAPSVDDVQAVRVPRGIRGLVALQKLSMIQVNGEDHIVLSELGNLTQLRRLGVGGLRSEDGWKICSSIQQMKNLSSLSLNSRNVDEPLELEYPFSSPPPHLQRLHLQGRLLTLPGWILNLTRLKCLTLGGSHFKHDPFQELVALTALKELTLLEAYDGNELDCKQSGNGSGFPNLELLSLNGLHRLEAIHLVEGAMPNLQKIIIKSCKKLRTVPLEIKYLPVLKEVELSDVSAALMSSIQNAKQLKHVKLSIGISRNV